MTKVLQQLYDLSFAIFSLDYAKVEQCLTDENFEINFYFPRFKKLPRDQAIDTMDLNMIRLFLNCPRVDWLKLNEINFDDLERFGIELDEGLKDKASLKKSKVEQFQCLNPWLEKCYPLEAILIYDKMFKALEGESEEEMENLIFKTYKSNYAFEYALSFCKDINKTYGNDKNTILHFFCQSTLRFVDEARIVISLGADVNAKNASGKSPLLCCDFVKNIEMVEFLISNGANLGNSYLHAGIEVFLSHFELVETTFISLLNGSIEGKTLKLILEKYPQYLDIFMQNLVENLSCVSSSGYPEIFDLLESEADKLEFCKLKVFKFSRSNSKDIPKCCLKTFTENVNELLDFALENSLNYSACHLISSYNADPNRIVNDLPPLFRTDQFEIVIKLIEAGADVLYEVDGR